MTVPAGIIMAWPDTEQTIPAGWRRVAALDGRYLRGASVAGGEGGSETHTHTAASTHSHSVAAHSHTVSFSNMLLPGETHYGYGTPSLWVGQKGFYHSHTSSLSTATTISLQSASITVAAAPSDPPYLDVLWVEPDGAPAEMGEGLIAWCADGSPPGGWAAHEDAAGRFLRGAAVGEPGGSDGGSGTHNHDSPAHNHTLSPSSHTHVGSESSEYDYPATLEKVGSGRVIVEGSVHTHTYDVNSRSGFVAGQEVSIGQTDCLPEYIGLLVVRSEAAILRRGIIAAWLGAAENIPEGWAPCDGEADTPDLTGERLVRGVEHSGQLLALGGDGEHGHDVGDHTHHAAHSHTSSNQQTSPLATCLPEPLGPSRMHPHEHAITIGTADPAVPSRSTPINTAVISPPYADVIFIMCLGIAPSERSIAAAENIYGQRFRSFDAPVDATISFERLDHPAGLWSSPSQPFELNAHSPAIECLPDGRLRAAYVDAFGALQQAISPDDGETWEPI